jgi:hypothetical protein
MMEEKKCVMMEAFSALVSTGCTPPISPEFSADAPRCFIGVLGIKHPVFPLYLVPGYALRAVGTGNPRACHEHMATAAKRQGRTRWQPRV